MTSALATEATALSTKSVPEAVNPKAVHTDAVKADAVKAEAVKIDTRDGYQLAATVFYPAQSNQRAVIINGATGVLQQYYHSYARYLCGQGFTVLTYDYRGIGGSQKCKPTAPPPTMLHWGQEDMHAVVSWLQRQHPELSIHGIGHSIGGALLGVMPDNNRYHSYLTVASQNFYWGNWPRRGRLATLLFFGAALPVFYTLLGKLPSWVLGTEALPRGIARDWSRWGRKKTFIANAQGAPLRDGFKQYRGKVRLYAIADDHTFAPENCVRELDKLFNQADSHVKVLRPGDYQMKTIDHFGFFKSSMHRDAWQETADWLRETTQAKRSDTG